MGDTNKRGKNRSNTYTDPSGQNYSDPVELSAAVLSNYVEMEEEILSPDSDLKRFLRDSGLDDTVDMMEAYIADGCPFEEDGSGAINRIKAFMAAYYLAVMLDPDLNYPVWTNDGWDFVESVDELLARLSAGKHDDPMPLNMINQIVLTCPALAVWLSNVNPQLADKIKALHDNRSDELDSEYYNSDSAYRIAYELNPDADLFFNTDTNSPERCYTIVQLGEFLNRRLNLMALDKTDRDAFLGEFCQIEDFPVGDFCRARGGKYMDCLLKGMVCMDPELEYNKNRIVPYDYVIGAYKTTALFLGHAPTYPIGDKLLTDAAELKNYPQEKIRVLMSPKSGNSSASRILESLANKHAKPEKTDWSNLPTGAGKPMPWLYAWLSVMCQENPGLNVEILGTYERELAKYTEFVGSLLPKDYYYIRYNRAMEKMKTAANKLRKSTAALRTSMITGLLVGGIPTVLVLILSWFFDYPTGNPINGHFFTAALICSVACVISLCFGSFGGVKMVIPGIIAGVVCAGLAWAGFKWMPSIFYFLVGLALLASFAAAFMAMKKSIRLTRVKTGSNHVDPYDPDNHCTEALYFAYRSEEQDIDCANTRFAERQRDFNRTSINDIRDITCLWAPVAWMVAVIWFFVTPGISGTHAWIDSGESAGVSKVVPGQWALGRWEAKYVAGSTRIVCNIDSVANGKNIFGTMEIAGQAPVKAKGVIRSDNDTIPASLIFYPAENHSTGKQEIDADYSKSDKEMTGYYYDRKGIMHQIKFLSTPLNSPEP